MDMSLLGIIVALVVLIIICYRKFNPVVGTLICVAILAIFSGLSVLDTITDTINEQIQNIAQKKDTLCRRMYN